eukprot:136979_1
MCLFSTSVHAALCLIFIFLQVVLFFYAVFLVPVMFTARQYFLISSFASISSTTGFAFSFFTTSFFFCFDDSDANDAIASSFFLVSRSCSGGSGSFFSQIPQHN